MDAWECDCEVVDDPDEVCPKHQDLLYEHMRALQSERDQAKAEIVALREALENIQHSLRLSWFTKENAQAIAKEALSRTQTKTEPCDCSRSVMNEIFLCEKHSPKTEGSHEKKTV